MFHLTPDRNTRQRNYRSIMFSHYSCTLASKFGHLHLVRYRSEGPPISCSSGKVVNVYGAHSKIWEQTILSTEPRSPPFKNCSKYESENLLWHRSVLCLPACDTSIIFVEILPGFSSQILFGPFFGCPPLWHACTVDSNVKSFIHFRNTQRC